MIYGYARVSTLGQCRDGNSLESQVAALEKYGCQEIIEEASAAKPWQDRSFRSCCAASKKGIPWWCAN